MNIEQSLEVMKGVGNMYKQMAAETHLPESQVIKLKHTVLELELIMISIRKNMEQINKIHQLHNKDKLKNKD